MTCKCKSHLAAARKPAFNAISRVDPTRTLTLRRRFVADVEARFKAMKKTILKSIVENDAFGLNPNIQALQAAPRNAFAFPRTDQKIAAFMEWLAEEQRRGVLEVYIRPNTIRGIEQAWTDTYIQSAYARGVMRGRSELYRAGYDVQPVADVIGGTSFIMNQPFHADRVALMYTRTFDDLKSVTDVMNARIRLQLAEDLTSGLALGIAEGKNPKTIAREMFRDVESQIDKIGITRAKMIARTEVIRAHHLAIIAEYRRANEAMKVSVLEIGRAHV